MVFEGEATMTDVDSVVSMMQEAEKIIIVPGYGLAVAKAQYPLQEIVDNLTKQGKEVSKLLLPWTFFVLAPPQPSFIR